MHGYYCVFAFENDLFYKCSLTFYKGSVKFWLKNEIAFNFLLLISLSRVRKKTRQVELEGKCEMKTIFVQISETIPQKWSSRPMGFEFLLASMVSNLCLFFFWKYFFGSMVSKGGATLIWYITEMQSGTPVFSQNSGKCPRCSGCKKFKMSLKQAVHESRQLFWFVIYFLFIIF